MPSTCIVHSSSSTTAATLTAPSTTAQETTPLRTKVKRQLWLPHQNQSPGIVHHLQHAHSLRSCPQNLAVRHVENWEGQWILLYHFADADQWSNIHIQEFWNTGTTKLLHNLLLTSHHIVLQDLQQTRGGGETTRDNPKQNAASCTNVALFLPVLAAFVTLCNVLHTC